MRVILNLRDLNKCLRNYKFRMLMGSWFTSVDLKDAYLPFSGQATSSLVILVSHNAQ